MGVDGGGRRAPVSVSWRKRIHAKLDAARLSPPVAVALRKAVEPASLTDNATVVAIEPGRALQYAEHELRFGDVRLVGPTGVLRLSPLPHAEALARQRTRPPPHWQAGCPWRWQSLHAARRGAVTPHTVLARAEAGDHTCATVPAGPSAPSPQSA